MKRSKKIQRIFTVGLLLTAANFTSKLLGLFRDILISNYYGSTAQTDAFFLSLSIPTILTGIFTSAADSAIIPQYNRILARSQNSREQADLYFSNIISFLIILGGTVAVFTLLFPQSIIFLFAPSFQGEQLEMACTYLRLFSFLGFFHILYCFFCSYLFCYEETTTRIILSTTTNILVVLSLLFLHDTGMYSLSFAYLAGSFFMALLPILSARKIGYRYHPGLSLKNYGFPEFIKGFLPIMGSALLADLLLYFDRFLTSFLPAGNLSALNYASKMISIFDNISVVGVSAVLLPAFTQLQIERKFTRLRFVSSAVYFCAALILFPIACYAVLYACDLVSFLYVRGAFTVDAAQTVSVVFRAYGPQILLSPLYMLLVKTLHAMGNTRFPFRVSWITFMMNIVLSTASVRTFGIFGIALATTLSQLAGCILLLWKIKGSVGFSKDFFSPVSMGKFLLCGSGIFILWRFLPHFSSSFKTVLLSGLTTVSLYFILGFLLFRRELTLCKKAIQQK